MPAAPRLAGMGGTMAVPPRAVAGSRGNSQFWGDYIGLATKGNNAVPIWSDSRDDDVFVCPGTAVPGTPPALCTATEPNGIVANDENIYLDVVDLPTR